jgi:hypothetical protein
MLSQEDLKWNYGLFNLASSLGILPLNFLKDSVQTCDALRRWVFVSLWVGVAGSVLWRGAHLFWTIRRGNPNLDFISMSAVLLSGILTTAICAHFLFTKNPSLTLKLYSEILVICRKIHILNEIHILNFEASSTPHRQPIGFVIYIPRSCRGLANNSRWRGK